MTKPPAALRVLRVLAAASLFTFVPTIRSCSEGDGSMEGELGAPLGWGSLHSMAGYDAGAVPTFSGAPDAAFWTDAGVGLAVVGGLELSPIGGLAAMGVAIAFALFVLATLVPFPFSLLEFPYPPVMFFVHAAVWTAMSGVAHRLWRKRTTGQPARAEEAVRRDQGT